LKTTNVPGGAFAPHPAAWTAGRRKSDIAVDECRELRLRKSADLGRRDASLLEQHQRRDSPDVELGRGHGILIYVQFCHSDLVRIVLGDLVEDGGNHLAGSAPLRPV